jgi:hypothetical protein
MLDGRNVAFVASLNYVIRQDPDPWIPGRFLTTATCSAELRNLVMHCLEWHAPDRPALIHWKNRIDRSLNGRVNLGPGLVQFFDDREFRFGARRSARRQLWLKARSEKFGQDHAHIPYSVSVLLCCVYAGSVIARKLTSIPACFDSCD